VPNCINFSMKGKAAAFKADSFLKKSQEIPLKVLVTPKDLWRGQGALACRRRHQGLLLDVLLYGLFLKLLPVGIAFVGMVTNL